MQNCDNQPARIKSASYTEHSNWLPHQVVVSQARDVSWLHAQIRKCLCCRVNDLVDELPLDFIARRDRPPEKLVENLGSGFQKHLWEVDMTPALDDLFVYQFRDLS